MQKKIVWITANYYIDVDFQIVPYLSKYYHIDWYIIGKVESLVVQQITEVAKNNNIQFNHYTFEYNWYSPFIIKDYLNLYSSIKKKQFDLLYIDSTNLLYQYPVLDYLFKKKQIVLAAHNLKTPKGARFETLAKLNMFYLMKRFKNIHIFSENQKKYLQENEKNKNILLAPLALKDYGELPKRTIQEITFLSFGHIRAYKRIDLLIEAAQLAFEETKTKFKVVIAGNCPNWGNYKKKIRYPFLFDCKIGYIDDSDIPYYFANANYLGLPYQDLAQSGAIMVAFNYKLPVIVSDIAPFKEVITDGINGYLFQSESIESLKKVIIDCLNKTENSYNKLCERVNAFVDENYNIEIICNKYKKYFNDLIG